MEKSAVGGTEGGMDREGTGENMIQDRQGEFREGVRGWEKTGVKQGVYREEFSGTGEQEREWRG